MTGSPPSLLDLPAGGRGRILEMPPGPLRLRLASLGLVHGATVELLESTPAVLARIGATTLALEREVGARILVQREEDGLQPRA